MLLNTLTKQWQQPSGGKNQNSELLYYPKFPIFNKILDIRRKRKVCTPYREEKSSQWKVNSERAKMLDLDQDFKAAIYKYVQITEEYHD